MEEELRRLIAALNIGYEKLGRSCRKTEGFLAIIKKPSGGIIGGPITGSFNILLELPSKNLKEPLLLPVTTDKETGELFFISTHSLSVSLPGASYIISEITQPKTG